MAKSDTSSPTVSLEVMMISRAIYTKENRYEIVTNIPRVLLHADMEEEVHMLLEGLLQSYSSNSTQNCTENTYGEI